MFKITLLFESNIEGVYTKEEETATDEAQTMRKLERMIDRWSKILIPFINTEDLYLSLDESDLPLLIDEHFLPYFKSHMSPVRKTILMLIDNHIDILNKFSNATNHNRSFSIRIQKF